MSFIAWIWSLLRPRRPDLLAPGLYISPTCRLHRVMSTTEDGQINVEVDNVHRRVLDLSYFNGWERVDDDEGGLARAMGKRHGLG